MFLGACMTVLQVERTTGALVHAALGVVRDDAIDLSLRLDGPIAAPAPIAGLADVTLEPGSLDRTVHITRSGRDLWAVPGHDLASFRDRSERRFAFLLVGDEDMARLRHLMRSRWVLGHTQEGPELTVVPADGWLFDLGFARLDLRKHMPRGAGPTAMVLDCDAGEISLTRIGEARGDIALSRRARYHEPPFAETKADLQAGPDKWLQIQGEDEYLSLPITVCDADRQWMFARPYNGQDQRLGRQRCQPIVTHEANKCVMMARHAEGVVFDANGVCNEAGYLGAFGHGGARHLPLPPGMRCDHDRLFADPAVIADAPLLSGPHIVFTPATLSNYSHWLIDGLLPLHVLLQYAPAGARLLLPATLHTLQTGPTPIVDHHETLQAFGYGELARVEVVEPFCRVESAWWLDRAFIDNMPGAHIRALRARMARLRPRTGARDRHIHIARRGTRRVADPEAMAPFLEKQGFQTVFLEDLTFLQQVDLFARAAWVIGPHGAELGNLLFCAPGTKVLELVPDCDFKPYFSYMCNKLGLTHGVLPCATSDGGFNGAIIPDMVKLTALFRVLKNRL